jgi:hypothetical protein
MLLSARGGCEGGVALAFAALALALAAALALALAAALTGIAVGLVRACRAGTRRT